MTKSQRQTDEPEVTPAMLAAVMREWRASDWGDEEYPFPDLFLTRVIKAALLAQRHTPIEISSEMEAAGIRVLEESGYLDKADSGFLLLPREVFEAMWLCRLREIAERNPQISESPPAFHGSPLQFMRRQTALIA